MRRYKILKENLTESGVHSRAKCDVIHGDFLKLDPADARLKDCTKALVDPSCSGGGNISHEVCSSVHVCLGTAWDLT